MTLRLLEPMLTGGLRHPNFANGIVLTAEALAAGQAAGRSLHRRLARALGPGVVEGLEVRLLSPGTTLALPQLSVSRGLAISLRGDTLALSADVVLEPVPPAVAAPASAGLFGDCEAAVPPPTGSSGVFLLAMGADSGFAEKTLRIDLVSGTPSPDCANRFKVEGVRFKLVPMPQSIDVTDARLRNLVAHDCFGTAALAERSHDPFVPLPSYGAVDALLATANSGLSDCDVPLAVLAWYGPAITFLDTWSVRRRPQGTRVEPLWPEHHARRTTEAEAVLFQFQQELAELIAIGAAPTTVAWQRFRYLPAAGYLPVGAGEFTEETFFSGLEVLESPLDEAFLRQIVQTGFLVEPLDLDPRPPILLHRPPGDVRGWLVFSRFYGALEAVPAPSVETPTEPAASTGALSVTVTADLTSGPVLTALAALAAPTKMPKIEVTATDAAGRVRQGQRAQTRGIQDAVLDPRAKARSGLLFRFPALEPGDYTVRVRAAGFRSASRAVTLTAGGRVAIVVTLRATSDKHEPALPRADQDFTWHEPGWYERMVLVSPKLGSPWPPRESERTDPIGRPPEAVLRWAADWAVELARRFPEVPIDPGEAQIILDPNHTPRTVAEAPYAYLAFGQGGAYAPLLLVPAGANLPRDVALDSAGLAGIDAPLARTLAAEAGIGGLQVLAAAWSGLVAEVLGTSPAAGAALIAEARGRVEHFRGPGELDTFHGMNERLKQALAAEAITGAVTLANAEPSALAAKLRGLGVTASDAFVQRLVEQARATTAAGSWSLAGSGLGLDEAEMGRLAGFGVTSQGGLKTAVQEKGLAALEAVLGRDTTGLGPLIGRLDVAANETRFAEASRAAAPVTTIAELGGSDARRLAAGGLASIGILASASVDAVAAVLGGDRAKAELMVSRAKDRLTVTIHAAPRNAPGNQADSVAGAAAPRGRAPGGRLGRRGPR